MTGLKFYTFFIILFPMPGDRYVDWIETDISRYAGEYVYFEFNGSEVSRQESLAIAFPKGKLSVAHAVKNRVSQTAESTIKQNEFTMRFKGLARKARFVKRVPPPNAKGRIDSGILVGRKFFYKTEELDKQL